MPLDPISITSLSLYGKAMEYFTNVYPTINIVYVMHCVKCSENLVAEFYSLQAGEQ